MSSNTNGLEHTFNKRVTSKSKSLIDVIITNNRDTVLPAETSSLLSIAMLSDVQLISESKELNHLKSIAEIMPIIYLKIL